MRVLFYVPAGPKGEHVWSLYRCVSTPDGSFSHLKHAQKTIKRLIWNPTPGENCHPWAGGAIAAQVYKGNTLIEGWVKDAASGKAKRVSAEEIRGWWERQEDGNNDEMGSQGPQGTAPP